MTYFSFALLLFVVSSTLVILTLTSVSAQNDHDDFLLQQSRKFQQFRTKNNNNNNDNRRKSVFSPKGNKKHQHKQKAQKQQHEEEEDHESAFYPSSSNGDQKKKNNKRSSLENRYHDLHIHQNGKIDHDNGEQKEGNPWSWSGSSWSFSSQGSSGSSSSSSSSSGSSSIPTPIPPGPPEPTFTSSTTSLPTPIPPGPPEPTFTTTTTPSPSGSSSSSSSSSSGSSSSGSSGSSQPYTDGHIFKIFNNCTSTIWVAILGNPGFATIRNGGFVMSYAGPPEILHIPEGWQGRIWARIDCKFNATGTCNPPYQPCCASGSCLQADRTFGLYCADSGISPTSLIEMSLDNPSPLGPYDDYDVSLVDGWSVPLSIKPVPGTYNVKPDPGVKTPWCEFSGCYDSPACPPALALNSTTLSCLSPCQAVVRNGTDNKHEIERACCICSVARASCDCPNSNNWSNPLYGCCRGRYGCSPYHLPAWPNDETCDPWSTTPGRGWEAGWLDYINAVRGACNQVYAWQFDDKAASFQCRKTGGYVDYDIVFVTRLRDAEKDMRNN